MGWFVEDEAGGEHPDKEPGSGEDEKPFPVDGVGPAEEFDACDDAEKKEE